MFLPEKASYKVDSLSQLTPELVDQLLEHFVDPVEVLAKVGNQLEC